MTPDRSAPESRLTGRCSTLVTLAALGAVLLVFAGLALGGAVRGSASAEDARRSGDLASAYLRTLDAMSREDTVEDVYADEPGTRLRVRFDRAAADLERALVELVRRGGPRDRALARRVSPLHVATRRRWRITSRQSTGTIPSGPSASTRSAPILLRTPSSR